MFTFYMVLGYERGRNQSMEQEGKRCIASKYTRRNDKYECSI